jgi:hypothetical protein
MKRIRLIGTCVAIGGAAILSGCVAGPGYGYGTYGSPYASPYYDQGPAYVPGPSVYIEGGGGYYGRPHYGGPAYYGRPGYDHDGRRGARPVPGPRPGWNGGGNPGRAQLPPPVVGALPGAPPSAASIMRPPPGRSLREQPALADRP